MQKVQVTLPVEAYARLRELVVAGGKWSATGEAGLHAASQLLQLLDANAKPVEEVSAADDKPVDKGPAEGQVGKAAE